VDQAAAVGVGEPVADFRGDFQLAGKRHRVGPGEAVLQVLASQQLHGEIGLPLVLAEIMDGDDVAVRQLTGRTGLAKEPFTELGVAFDGGADDFQGDFTFEQRVLGAIDDTHSSLPDFFEDLVAADRVGQCSL
jgi:hypothetical protein